MTARRLVAPSIAPVSLDDAKMHLRVDASAEDDLINGLIDAATSHLDGEGVLGRAIITQTWAEWVSNSPGWVRLPIGNFQAVTAVDYYDADNVLQPATLSDFETRLDGDHVLVKPITGKTWPSAYSRSDAIRISYTAGYGDAAIDVPASVTQAILLMVGHWYEHRMAVSEGSLKEVPMAVDALIGAERLGWYG